MTVLVTGATGNVGSQVVRELRERGVPVRAFVRDRDRATAALGADVELAVGDFSASDSIRHALAGVDRVFLACGNVPGQVGYERNAIEVAKAAGVTRIVKLSAAGAAVDSPLLFPRWQGEIERHLAESGLPAVLLHPRVLMTNLLAAAEPVRRTGKLFAPAGAATIPFIDPRDVAATAAVTLTEDGHEGQTYVLTGPDAITYQRIAEHLSEATGCTIDYVDIPGEAARQSMLDSGIPSEVAEFFVLTFAALRNGMHAETTDVVRTLTGSIPRDFGAFARDHAARFAAGEPALADASA
jgi:uncharacterized protein YbjT (DUF2867 family)